MCGVFGYVGEPVAVIPMVATKLRIMEYRGYDSWGIGWDSGTSVRMIKHTGRVPAEVPGDGSSSIAIGHTRWATHGGVTDRNAHPHTDCSGQIAVVHNGVIENALELKTRYLSGIDFRSETDSEIVPHLIRLFMDAGSSFPEAVRSAFLALDGSSAIVAMDRTTTMLVAITARSPLRLGRRPEGWELASDPLACAGSSSEIAIVPDNHLVILTPSSAQIVDVHVGSETALAWAPVPEELIETRGAFAHFTIKEIHDQPSVIRGLVKRAYEARTLATAIRRFDHILLTGCGSAFYAASLGATWMHGHAQGWVDVIPASEISEHTRNLGDRTLMIALTQSGETADVVDALQHARRWGASTAAIVNTETSTVANMVDIVLPISAGVERSVLATKSFMGMAVRLRQLVSGDEPFDPMLAAIEQVLADESLVTVAKHLANAKSMIVLGKHIGRPIAQEAALKIKEGSYLHAEAFLTGELKHGPLALIDAGTPCLLFATTPDELDAGRIAAAEVMSRGGFAIGIGEFAPSDCSLVIPAPGSSETDSLVHLAIAQTLAYHITVARGLDPDFPRNLAKSVTVR